jgi:hypothetical protein
MTTKLEKGLRNSAQITRDDVLRLMFDDGFGIDEALAYSREYAVELTGLASPTAISTIERHIRSTIR